MISLEVFKRKLKNEKFHFIGILLKLSILFYIFLILLIFVESLVLDTMQSIVKLTHKNYD